MAISLMLDVRNANGASLGQQPDSGRPAETIQVIFQTVPAVAMVGVPGFGIVSLKGRDAAGAFIYSWMQGADFVEGNLYDLKGAIGAAR